MRRLAVIVVVALAGEAAAQPGATPIVQDREEPPGPLPPPPMPAAHEEVGFVGGGLILGADQFLDAALVVEGGLKLASLPLWVRGLVAKGTSFDFEGGGD